MPILVFCFFAALGLSAEELKLPDPLINEGGAKVASVEAWKTQRRGEILELFRKNIYGRMPLGKPETLRFSVYDGASNALGGAAKRKQVRISYSGAGGTGAINLVLFTPRKVIGPAPCFLLICNRGSENIDPTRESKSEFWPAEEIVARGYAAAAFLNADVAPDQKDAWQKGAHKIFDPPSGRQPDSWGTIAAWAWGASRVMDYLETDKDVDSTRVAVVGHSRGGKTALWAGAEDERFAMVVSNDSGSTGAAIARNKVGEHVRDINRGFPHWFCDNYKKFNDREQDLPVDQHMLLALIAPRSLYVASASEDTWADPKSEFLAAVHASPVYRLFGLKGVESTRMPLPETPLHSGCIGHHIRTGQHNLTKYDWQRFMDFADLHWK